MAEYKNSIAQDRVQFPIQTVISPQAGGQFSRVVVYLSATDLATYVNGAIEEGKYKKVMSNTYKTDTKGALLDTLALFFANATTAEVYLVNPLASDDDLSKTYELTKELGYFKTAIASANGTTLNTSLAKLCSQDEEYSLHFVTVSEDITGGNTEDSALTKALIQGKYASFVKYHPTQDIAFAQLGKTLSSINSTSTPVGNSLDMIAMSNIVASGAAGINLSLTQKNNLDNLHIGYSTAVGDGTDNVVVEGSMDLNGNSVGARWMKAYITYMCRIRTASFISQGNIFNNSTSYVVICAILRDALSKFETLGRLRDVAYSFPAYSTAVAQGFIVGDVIRIPNAWSAIYVDNVRDVAIYGTLFVEQPTR